MKRLYFFLIVILLFSACSGRTNKNAVSGKKILDVPDMELRDFTVEQSYKNTTDWILTAQYAAIYDKSNVMNIKGIKIHFLKNKLLNRKNSAFVRSNFGVLNMQTKDLKLSGAVYLRTDAGIELWTQELNWDNNAGKIMTEKQVKIKQGNSILIAKGMVSSPNLEDITLKNVEGSIRGTGPGR